MFKPTSTRVVPDMLSEVVVQLNDKIATCVHGILFVCCTVQHRHTCYHAHVSWYGVHRPEMGKPRKSNVLQ